MSITSLRNLARLQARPVTAQVDRSPFLGGPPESFGIALLRAGLISSQHLMDGLAAQTRHDRRLTDSLLAMRAMSEQALYAAMSQHWSVGLIDFEKSLPDPALIAVCDPITCAKQAWVPWRKLGQTTVIVCAYPEDFATLRPNIEAIFGPVVLAVAPQNSINAALMARAGAVLARHAETRVVPADSCRNYKAMPLIKLLATLALGLAAFAYFLPTIAVVMLFGITLILAYAQTLLKVLAVLPYETPHPETAPISDKDLPLSLIHI
jgi:hypothetical protein